MSKRKKRVLNSKGEPITLTPRENKVALYNENILKNQLGYEIDITTLTAIVKKVTEQKFFEIAPADYVPIQVGFGAWTTQLTTWRTFHSSDDFETGLINTGSQDNRYAQSDIAIDSVTVPVHNWAKDISWTIFDLAHASESGNWDLVEKKSSARKKNWDIGIQEVAFLGLARIASTTGLFGLPGVTTNTTRITNKISALSAADLNTFLINILADYRANALHTAWPDRFVIPESDYLGLMAPSSAQFPIKSKLKLLEETFQTLTKNEGFKILPCAYADKSMTEKSVSATDNYYALYRYDQEALRMDIPVDYTSTTQSTINGAQFHNVGYGQFTGVQVYRPREIMYFTNQA